MPSWTAEQLLDQLRRAVFDDKAHGGWPAIAAFFRRWLAEQRRVERSAFVLWGTYHDAPAQAEAFGRLLRPDLGLTHAALEQFDADGRWRGAPDALQRGDSELLARFAKSGSPRVFRALRRRQLAVDYTAWKYGYTDALLEAVLLARGANVALCGCDMSRSLRDRLGDLPGDLLLRLRELHCALALRDCLARPSPNAAGRRLSGRPAVAMLWGQQHIAPRGVRQFFLGDARVLAVYVFGGRPGPHGPEVALARRLRLTAPLLLALRPDRAVLLLPAGALRGRVERRREGAARASSKPAHLTLASRSGELLLAHRRLSLAHRRSRPLKIDLPAGPTPYLLSADGRLLAGALPLDAGALIEARLDARRGLLDLAIHHPDPAAR